MHPIRTNKRVIALLLCTFCIIRLHAEPGKRTKPSASDYTAYLFVYFTGNDIKEEQLRFAISGDGYRYYALNRNEPVIGSARISETGGIRDPHILRGADGKTFYMVATDMVSAKGWDSNRGIVLLRSTDLIHWNSSTVNIQAKYTGEEDLQRVWAPQTIYDDSAGKYLIYFSMKNGQAPDKIYYAYANEDFTDIVGEPRQLFFNPDSAACIDGDLLRKDGKFYLFFKTENRLPGIQIAVSDHLTGGYALQSPDYVQQTRLPVEGAGTFKLNDGSGYILMYDMYTSGRYQFTKTTDLRKFAVVDAGVCMDFHPRHGAVMSITTGEAKRLVANWLPAGEVLGTLRGRGIRKEGTVVDTTNKTIELSMSPGADLHTVKLHFDRFPGVKISPSGARDFTHGPVSYTVSLGDNTSVYKVKAVRYKTPFAGNAGLAESDRFTPGGVWKDTDGQVINAHGGGVLYADGYYYWFGEKRGVSASEGISVYASRDLYHWTYGGLALGPDAKDTTSDIAQGCIMERPKVLYNAKTRKYILWFHLELRGQGYGSARAAVASSDRITGPYVFLRSCRPNNNMSRDITLFEDKDGTAYLVYSSRENYDLRLVQLSDDYTTPTEKDRLLFSQQREAPAMFAYQGSYYLITSACTGWAPNQATLRKASSPWGPWEEVAGNPMKGPHAEITFGGQSNYVLPVQGRRGAFIFMADSWNPRDLRDSRYIWLPIDFTGGAPSIRWMDNWSLGYFARVR